MIETIYIAPGNSQCRVYAIPYPMRQGQSPADIHYEHQKHWKEIGLLNHKLEVVYLSKGYQHLRHEIEGQCGGTFFQTGQVSDIYQVAERAGTDAERVVFSAPSFTAAAAHRAHYYTQEEQEQYGVDILKNGSTEF